MRAKIEQASKWAGTRYHRFLKRQHRRFERHKAKRDPECMSGYNKYWGTCFVKKSE
jgi:hypothetical protein